MLVNSISLLNLVSTIRCTWRGSLYMWLSNIFASKFKLYMFIHISSQIRILPPLRKLFAAFASMTTLTQELVGEFLGGGALPIGLLG